MLKNIAVLVMLGSLLLPIAASADTNISAAGSTALLPLVKESAQSYQEKHPDIKVSVAGGGSYAGINQAMTKAVDIGDSDVIAPGNSGLKDHRVAVVGFAIVANKENGVSALSRKQARDIFSGRITNWKNVGGKDLAIVVINRPRSSGTRAVFNATVMGTSKISESGLVEDSSGQVVTTVGTTPGAVTYVALAYTKNHPVTVLKLDGVAPTEENIRTGKYAVWSYEHMFTHSRSPGQAEDFIKYVMNNRDVLEKLGYIMVSTMKVKESNR